MWFPIRKRRALTTWQAVPVVETLEVRTLLTNLPTGFVESEFVSGLNGPTSMEQLPDGRWLVTEQGGTLQVVSAAGVLAGTPALQLSVNSDGERGLLGVAPDPDFASNQYIYLYYTVTSGPQHNRVSRFTMQGDLVLPESEQVLLDLDNLSASTNHNGGALHFGQDGKLYIGVGDNANGSNSQSLESLLGKILRINSDGTIPTDNPFYETATGNNRAIWALGLRNPFTFEVQPGTGRIFINDVGQSAWEEINDGQAGANYGWPAEEGFSDSPDYVDPLFAYAHSNHSEESYAITGGVFYNPDQTSFPSSFVGDYFYMDLAHNWIRRFDPQRGSDQAFATDISSYSVDLNVDPQGRLYYLSLGTGTIQRISFPGKSSQPLAITVPAEDIAAEIGGPPVLLNPTGTIQSAAEFDFAGTRLQLQVQGRGNKQQVLAISPTGTDPGQIGVAGTTITFGGTEIAHFSTGRGQLEITFLQAADVDAIEAVVQRITFAAHAGKSHNHVRWKLKAPHGPKARTTKQTIALTAAVGG